MLATRYGLKAADLVQEGRFGRMAALQATRSSTCRSTRRRAELKTVPPDWYEVAQAFSG